MYVIENILSHSIILKKDCHIDDSLFMIVIQFNAKIAISLELLLLMQQQSSR